MLSGYNLSKDLFMYVKKRITGLRPNTDYTITFQVELASDLNTASSGGSGSVSLKAGATQSEPKSVIEAGYYVMNIDKGNEASAGEDMMSLGILPVQTTSPVIRSLHVIIPWHNTAMSPEAIQTGNCG
jgi:hypothetical protein